MLLEKKHFWNNIGRCRFEVQNAGIPAKSGTLGALGMIDISTTKFLTNVKKFLGIPT